MSLLDLRHYLYILIIAIASLPPTACARPDDWETTVFFEVEPLQDERPSFALEAAANLTQQVMLEALFRERARRQVVNAAQIEAERAQTSGHGSERSGQAEEQPRRSGRSRARRRRAQPQMLNPNTASAAQLVTLPGVGPAIAARIIDARPYSSAEDLLQVSGIGRVTLDRLRPWLSFE